VEAEVEQLATYLLGNNPAPVVKERLWIQSEGNPFVLEELIQAWRESGEFVQCVQPAGASAGLPEMTLPASLKSLIHQRLSHLPTEVVKTLRTAAIIGRLFTSSFLAEVMGQDQEQIEERLQIALSAGLLRGISADAYSFSHDTIRAALYSDLTLTRRKRLHGFIGHSLAGQSARSHRSDAQHLAQLAFHFAHSGDRPLGVLYARQAAEQAMQAAAPLEAMRQYQTALELLDPQTQDRGELLQALGEAAVIAAQEQSAIQAFTAAQEWFASQQDAVATARALFGKGQALARLTNLAEGQAALEEALDLLQEYSGQIKVQILVELSTLLSYSLTQRPGLLAYGYKALELAQQLGDQRLLAMAMRVLGNLLVFNTDFTAAIPLLEEALTLAVSKQDMSEAGECCAGLYRAYYRHNEYRRTYETLLYRLELAQMSREPYQLRNVYPHLARLSALQGAFAEAERWLALAETALAPLARSEPRSSYYYACGFLAFTRGEYDAAEEYIAQMVAQINQAQEGDMWPWDLAYLGWMHAVAGKKDAALARLQEVEALLANRQPYTIIAGDVISMLAEIALIQQDQERIDRYYTLLLPFQGHLMMDRILGKLAMARQSWTEAYSYLTSVEHICRREHLQGYLVDILQIQAQLAKSTGNADSDAQVARYLKQALEIAAECQMPRIEAALCQQLPPSSEPVRIPATQHPTHISQLTPQKSEKSGAGLTARESEIIRLVADGLSNRQIAEKLVLSERTVGNHLMHIFTKLGVSNRTAATAYAHQYGLNVNPRLSSS
jgi:DNA-binding CsgD family transcriptional regulator/tetratricopeptide (TPR) repeat protein